MSIKNLYTNKIKIYQQLKVNSSTFVNNELKTADFDLSINGLNSVYLDEFEYEIVGDFLIGLFKLSTQQIVTGSNVSNMATIILSNEDILPRYSGTISTISIIIPPLINNNEFVNMSYNSNTKTFEIMREDLSDLPTSISIDLINIYVFWFI